MKVQLNNMELDLDTVIDEAIYEAITAKMKFEARDYHSAMLRIDNALILLNELKKRSKDESIDKDSKPYAS